MNPPEERAEPAEFISAILRPIYRMGLTLLFNDRILYVFCIYLRTNSDFCHLYNKLIGFRNRVEKCLQRGKNWVFK
jgi:hypothetical protein